jgi:hypothetical protein
MAAGSSLQSDSLPICKGESDVRHEMRPGRQRC